MSFKFKQYYYSILFSVVVLVTLYLRHSLVNLPSLNIAPQGNSEQLKQSTIRFIDESKSRGLIVEINTGWPNKNTNTFTKKLRTMAPSVAVADLDRDGYQDIVIATGAIDHAGLRIFKNEHGQSFTEITDTVLKGLESTDLSTLVAIADFNGDGWPDILVGRFGKHSLYYWSPQKGCYVDESKRLNSYTSNPWSVALLDFNKDGLIDILWGNYFPEIDLNTVEPMWLDHTARGDFKFGGQNTILENKNGSFEISDSFRPKHKAHTASVGVSDFNHDGWPDIFEGNDYAPDFLYFNNGGKDFQNVTAQNLPYSEHGFAGMNSEIFDFDFDGEQEIYISNISVYPLANQGNVLWKKNGDHYDNIAKTQGLDRCGYAWAAKFADFNLDGKNDLFVVNGGISGEQRSSPNYWFWRSLVDQTPKWLRDKMSHPRRADFNYSGYEKDCLFENQNGTFVNVSELAGVADEGDGRGLALGDFNNDGLVDAVVVNLRGPVRLYMNHSKCGKCRWIGFRLVDSNGSDIPIGAELHGHFADGRKLFREVYPLNGHNAQSDARYVFAVNDITDLKEVTVKWPNGHLRKYKSFELNKYNILEQDNENQ